MVDPFELGFPVTRLAAGLVNLQQAVLARAFELDQGRTGETDNFVR